MAIFERMLQLSTQGFACAQIMMQLILEGESKEDPDLIRSLGALNNGLRDSGSICGALLGGACIISYYAGQGQVEELADPDFDLMVQKLYEWFAEEMTSRYGGITCTSLLKDDQSNKLTVCPAVVEETFNKALEILDEYDLLA